ncbi:hypothetical protein TRV_06499 [Trichophyton verrucosum HKI 0517]|uniref:Uncharacterized protein n=1 Tax=Trichophyton verrucosum (strain HKI 0517) TaxID=663202 RepID=D4DH44_TRIVH|nr:uncharacterized protein TRV_06499 [Trichophyton verrucosum HKI 0517]EFE38825.1 hypothetical protein TRV_06499 [Trichophyton verrucosum HKI 0517]
MKFQAVLVFFAGALALAAPIEERDLPVVGTLGLSSLLTWWHFCLYQKSAKGAVSKHRTNLQIVTFADRLFKAGKVAPSAVDNLPAGGLVKGLPLAGGLLGGGAVLKSYLASVISYRTLVGVKQNKHLLTAKTVTYSKSVNGIMSDFAGKVMDSRASLLVIPFFSVYGELLKHSAM